MFDHMPQCGVRESREPSNAVDAFLQDELELGVGAKVGKQLLEGLERPFDRIQAVLQFGCKGGFVGESSRTLVQRWLFGPDIESVDDVIGHFAHVVGNKASLERQKKGLGVDCSDTRLD